MGYTTPEIRRLIVKAVREGEKVNDVARVFDVSRKTVWKWSKRCRVRGWPNYRDRPKRPHHTHPKVTTDIENAIIVLRDSFNWGTQRIKVNLERPPGYIRHLFETVLGNKWTEISLSRQAINDILKKHRRNGSPYKSKKNWKYFRAESPNQMWQMDLRGPVRIGKKRGYVLIILDDYSRYLLYCGFYTSITAEVVISVIKNMKERKPCKALVDNGPQFRETFENGCNLMNIEVIHAPPHYPQCKGKVERVTRTFNEEFLRLDKVYENAEHLMPEFTHWYNFERYHMGVCDTPANLYFGMSDVTHVT